MHQPSLLRNVYLHTNACLDQLAMLATKSPDQLRSQSGFEPIHRVNLSRLDLLLDVARV